MTPSLGWIAIVDPYAAVIAIYRTDDGTTHWRRVFTTVQANPQVPSLQFFDKAHGLLYAGRLYSTSDGGAHWITISVPDGTSDFVFPSPTKGWALDGLVLYSTQDGGLTWRTAGRAPSAFYGLGYGNYVFRPEGEGWGGGWGLVPEVYATFDGGATWRPIRLPATLVSIPSPEPVGKASVAGYSTAVHLVPGGGVMAVVSTGFGPVDFYVTSDRGVTWHAIKYPPMSANASDIAFIDSRHWWASQLGLIYKTSDAGRSWQEVHTTYPDGLDAWRLNNAPHVVDSRHAWLVISLTRGGRAALMMSSDGGAHWSLVNLPQPR